jgi:hypothetical protein
MFWLKPPIGILLRLHWVGAIEEGVSRLVAHGNLGRSEERGSE